MRKRIPFVVLAVVALLMIVLAASGCGGGDGGTDEAESPSVADTGEESAAPPTEAEGDDSSSPTDTTEAPSDNVLMGGSTYTGAPSGDPVRMLLVTDVAGKLGGFGPAEVRAMELMAEIANENGGILGRPVELVTRDSQGDGATAAREARSVLLEDGADTIIGPALSSELLTLGELSNQLQIPMISGEAGDIQFIREQGSIYHGMTSSTSQVDACAFAKFQGENHPEWKRVVLLVPKFAYSTDFATDYEECLAEFAPDAEVVARTDFELGVQNYVPFINAALGENPDFIMSVVFGSDALRFASQYLASGESIPFATYGDYDTIKELPNDIPPNFYYTFARALYMDIPEAQPWVDAYVEKYGEPPPDGAITGIGGWLAYKAAAEKAGSTEPEAVMEAFRCLTYYEPRGWITVRTLNGQASVPEYVGALVSNEEFGHPTFDPDDRATVFGEEVWPSDEEIEAELSDEAKRSAADCE